MYQYGVPTTTYNPNAPSGAPKCWGNAASYDNESRECKGCGFNNSCPDFIRKKAASGSTESHFKQFLPTTNSPQIQPLRIPSSVAPPMFRPAMPSNPAPFQQPQTQMQQPNHFQFPQRATDRGLPPPVSYGDYGWMTDPLHFALGSVPTPMRPQMPGEGFLERAGKNAMLSMAESFFMQIVLAIRQLVLAPASMGALPKPQNTQVPTVTLVPEKPK